MEVVDVIQSDGKVFETNSLIHRIRYREKEYNVAVGEQHELYFFRVMRNGKKTFFWNVEDYCLLNRFSDALTKSFVAKHKPKLLARRQELFATGLAGVELPGTTGE